MSDKILHPIVIYKGKRKSSLIRKLRKGRGKLAGKVSEVIGTVRAKIGDENKIIVPLIVHYTLKEDKAKAGGIFSN